MIDLFLWAVALAALGVSGVLGWHFACGFFDEMRSQWRARKSDK